MNLLTKTQKLECKPAVTAIEINNGLSETREELSLEDRGLYQRLVGKLRYLSLTWPDLTYAVSVISQFMRAPRTVHMKAVERILRYLKSCPEKRILFQKVESLSLEEYVDIDCVPSRDDKRSTSTYYTFPSG